LTARALPVYGKLLFRQATWHAALLHPFLYVIDFKRALGFGEAEVADFEGIRAGWHFRWGQVTITARSTGSGNAATLE